MQAFRWTLISEYSKGMRKKIGLASILLHDPQFIILDEPFEGLDTLSIIKLKKLLRNLRSKGKTILITSHILSFIEDLSDEVAIINHGKIVFQSKAADIRLKIKDEVSKETYNSLEEIFISMVSGDNAEDDDLLPWIK